MRTTLAPETQTCAGLSRRLRKYGAKHGRRQASCVLVVSAAVVAIVENQTIQFVAGPMAKAGGRRLETQGHQDRTVPDRA